VWAREASGSHSELFNIIIVIVQRTQTHTRGEGDISVRTYILERGTTVVIQMHTINEYYCIVLRLELVK